MDAVTIKRDDEFDRLVQPLSEQQKRALEAQILAGECVEPVYLWHGRILEGQDRFELCCKQERTIPIQELFFKSREEAVVWACNQQEKRLDLTKEMQKYLIGKQYVAEKILAARSSVGRNQYSEVLRETSRGAHPKKPQRRTAEPLGKAYGVCCATIQVYGAFATAVDQIARMDASLRNHLLFGSARVSQENVILIANMGESKIKEVARLFAENPDYHLRTAEIERIAGSRISMGKATVAEFAGPSVKDMPSYDPDLEVSALSLTIPSWKSSIGRVRNTVNLQSVTAAAQRKLEAELLSLREHIDTMLSAIKEGEIDE